MKNQVETYIPEYRPGKLEAPLVSGNRVGTLAPGLLADLLVIRGTPLELRSEVKHVFLNGRDLPLTSRQTRLYDKYNNRPRAGVK